MNSLSGPDVLLRVQAKPLNAALLIKTLKIKGTKKEKKSYH